MSIEREKKHWCYWLLQSCCEEPFLDLKMFETTVYPMMMINPSAISTTLVLLYDISRESTEKTEVCIWHIMYLATWCLTNTIIKHRRMPPTSSTINAPNDLDEIVNWDTSNYKQTQAVQQKLSWPVTCRGSHSLELSDVALGCSLGWSTGIEPRAPATVPRHRKTKKFSELF